MQWLFLASSVMVLICEAAWGKAVSGDSSLQNLIGPDSLKSNQAFGSCSEAHSLKVCLKMRSLMFLEDWTMKDSPISLLGKSLVLVKSEDVRHGRMLPVSEEELESSLPKEETARDLALDNLISSTLQRFFSSRALQIRLPDLSALWNSIEEGRKRKGAGMGLGWAFGLSGGMMGALGLGTIAMLAGKALTISMMALMLAALSALKKGGGGGGDHGTTYEVINVPTGHGHHGHGRSLVTGVDLPGGPAGAELAYRGHAKNFTESDDWKAV